MKNTGLCKFRNIILVAILPILLLGSASPRRVLAYSVAPGFVVTSFATNFPVTNQGVGPTGLAFSSSNTLFVLDYATGFLYRFGARGGVASLATQVNTTPITGGADGLAFGKDGRLYATMHDARIDVGGVVELNPATGAVVRTIATHIPWATGIATDPLSGDLFVSQAICAPSCNVLRISNFAHGPGTVSMYASTGATDGLTFTSDGTLYAALSSKGSVARIAGTDTATPGVVTPLAVNIPLLDGIGVATGSDLHRPPFLLVNRNNGMITKVDLNASPPTLTDIVTGGTRGDFVAVGPDGCFYATQSTSIVKVTNADGSCTTVPTSVVPQLGLVPAAVPSPLQRGTTQVFTATLSNVPNPSGTTITFMITGTNPQTVMVRADASGTATFSDHGNNVGTDSVVATARVGTASLTSNVGIVTWADVSAPPASPAAPTPPVGPVAPTPPASPSSTPTKTSGQGSGSHPPISRYTAPPALHVVMQPLLVQPGAIQHLVISYVKDALVQATVTFPDKQPLSLFGLTDTRARLALSATVPRNVTLRNGRATGHVIVQAMAGPWHQVALFLPVVRPGTVKRLAIFLPHTARTYVRALVTFPGQSSRALYDVTDAHGYAALNVVVPRNLARRHGQIVAQVSVWVLADRQHAQVSRLLTISDMVVSVVPGTIAHCLRTETVRVSYYAHTPVRITLLFPHNHRLVKTMQTDRYGRGSLRMTVERAAHPTNIGVQVTDARPHAHRMEYTIISVRPSLCKRA